MFGLQKKSNSSVTKKETQKDHNRSQWFECHGFLLGNPWFYLICTPTGVNIAQSLTAPLKGSCDAPKCCGVLVVNRWFMLELNLLGPCQEGFTVSHDAGKNPCDDE